MKEIIKKIPMQFINWNLNSLWIWTILLIFLYYLTMQINYILWMFVFFINITFATSLKGYKPKGCNSKLCLLAYNLF